MTTSSDTRPAQFDCPFYMMNSGMPPTEEDVCNKYPPKTGDSKNHLWKGVTGGGAWGQKVLLVMSRHLPLRALYAILAMSIPFIMLFRIKGYLSIYRYFREHFHYRPFRAFRKTCLNHFIFGQCLLDRFVVYSGRKHIFTMDNTEAFEKWDSEACGHFFVSAHVGNYELSGYLVKHKKQLHTVVFGGESAELTKHRERLFRENNVSMLPVSQEWAFILSIMSALSEGETVSMLCDRTFGSNKSVECDFLGGKADFPVGAFKIAVQCGTPIIAVFVLKKGLSRYHIHLKPLSVDTTNLSVKKQVRKYVAAFVEELESIVRMYPEQWFNYYRFWK
ncbi:MAG: lysophospholipid acyltransferase family protein [Bacteroidales bacterium]|jgi:predicted LPLAT superfamily acyltransferase|nr:lysophospholipid acyltransferase family protein [Bacteroidales bacterium]